MLKKGLLVGAGVALVLGLLFGRSGVSYVKTALTDVRQAVDDNIPVETKIGVARAEIEKLDDVVNSLAREIAKEETQITRLEEDLAAELAKLERDEAHIQKLTSHLEGSDSMYVVMTRKGKVSYSRDVVESDLRSCFETYKTNKATIDTLQKVVDARRQGLSAAQENFGETKIARHELQVQVENLQARNKMVEVARTSSSFHHDDSQLSRTRDLIDNIESRIEVEETLTHMGPTDTRIPRADEVEDNGDILNEVTSYFGGDDTHYVAEKLTVAEELTVAEKLTVAE